MYVYICIHIYIYIYIYIYPPLIKTDPPEPPILNQCLEHLCGFCFTMEEHAT